MMPMKKLVITPAAVRCVALLGALCALFLKETMKHVQVIFMAITLLLISQGARGQAVVISRRREQLGQNAA